MSPSRLSWCTFSAFVVFFVVLFLSAIPFFQQDTPLPLPDVSSANSFHAPRQNIWAGLSKQEANDVIKFLFSRKDLNLTDVTRATEYLTRLPIRPPLLTTRTTGTSGDNLLVLEALHPNKTHALRYINGASGAPSRWARALIVEFSMGEVHLADYMVRW